MRIKSLQDQKTERGQPKTQDPRAQAAKKDRLRDIAGNRRVIAFAVKAQKMHELFARAFSADAQRIAADETGAEEKHCAQRAISDMPGKGERFLGQFVVRGAEPCVQPAKRAAQMQNHAQRAQEHRRDDVL